VIEDTGTAAGGADVWPADGAFAKPVGGISSPPAGGACTRAVNGRIGSDDERK